MRKYLVTAASLLLLGGCANIEAAFAMMRFTDHFVALEGHPNIAYGSGAKEYATLISKYIHESIRIVRERQGGFPEGVLVYVPASDESFVKYSANPVRACVMGGRLFMSPRLMRKGRIPNILTHELSHLQIQQYVGRWNAQLHIPGWFGEGLATCVSNGGGAENVSRQQAMLAIKQGRHILPEGSSGLLFSRPPKVDGMPDRQSSVHNVLPAICHVCRVAI